MKLFELQVRDKRGTMEFEYMTNVAHLKKAFNAAVKTEPRSVFAHEIQVRTDLRIGDWVALLRSDAPGLFCEMTPVDLIGKRKLLRKWIKCK